MAPGRRRSVQDGRAVLRELEGRLGHAFGDDAMIWRALTHPSWAHEHPPALHNESLACLGDAVVGLLVADLLWTRDPAGGAGPLTEGRARFVSEPGLAAWARKLDLGAHLRLGRGEERSGGRDKDSILASGFEAVVAALYLDGGLEPVRCLIGELLPPAPRC